MSYKYRQVSQMSSTWSPKQYHKREDALQLDVKRSCSLPNIGNTCFLNSVIQVLFRLVIIKNFLLDYTVRNQLLVSLKQLFQQIIDQASTEKKKKTLFAIQKHIQPLLQGYALGKQFDSYETLMKFLNVLFEENCELQRQFEIKYTQKCMCDGYEEICEPYIEKQPKRCSKCDQIKQIKLKRLPECLIVRDQKKAEMRKELCGALKDYNLVSKNIYRGNGSFGHYYTLSKFQKFYELNDERVTEIDRSKFDREVCMFSIYERKEHNYYRQKVPVENPEQNNEENQGGFFEWVKQNPVKSVFIVIGIIGVCVGIGIVINIANAPSSSSQSNNFEIHQGLQEYQKSRLKDFFHQVQNTSSHFVKYFSKGQKRKQDPQLQGKQIRLNNIQNEEQQKVIKNRS